MGSLRDSELQVLTEVAALQGCFTARYNLMRPKVPLEQLGAVAHTFLFLTCFAHRGKHCTNFGYFLSGPKYDDIFNTERGWNPTSAVI